MPDLFTCLTITFCVCSVRDESECSSLRNQERGNAVQSLVTNVRSVRAKEDKALGYKGLIVALSLQRWITLSTFFLAL
jgi:hypothetical protein